MLHLWLWWAVLASFQVGSLVVFCLQKVPALSTYQYCENHPGSQALLVHLPDDWPACLEPIVDGLHSHNLQALFLLPIRVDAPDADDSDPFETWQPLSLMKLLTESGNSMGMKVATHGVNMKALHSRIQRLRSNGVAVDYLLWETGSILPNQNILGREGVTVLDSNLISDPVPMENLNHDLHQYLAGLRNQGIQIVTISVCLGTAVIDHHSTSKPKRKLVRRQLAVTSSTSTSSNAQLVNINGLDGTIWPSYVTSESPPKFRNGALTFNGTGTSASPGCEFLQFANFTLPLSTSGITIALTFKFTGAISDSGNERILDFGNGDGVSNVMIQRSGILSRLVFDVRNPSASRKLSPDLSFEQDRIYRVAFVYDHLNGFFGEMQMWVDGIKLTSSFLTGSRLTDRTVNTTLIGKSTTPEDSAFRGNIYSLKVFNRVLSDIELIEETTQFENVTIAISGASVSPEPVSSTFLAPIFWNISTPLWSFDGSGKFWNFGAQRLPVAVYGFAVTLVFRFTGSTPRALPNERILELGDGQASLFVARFGTTNQLQFGSTLSADPNSFVRMVTSTTFDVNVIHRVGFVYEPDVGSFGRFSLYVGGLFAESAMASSERWFSRNVTYAYVGKSLSTANAAFQGDLFSMNVYPREVFDSEVNRDTTVTDSVGPFISILGNTGTILPSGYSTGLGTSPSFVSDGSLFLNSSGLSTSSDVGIQYVNFGRQNFTLRTTGFSFTVIFRYSNVPISNERIFDFSSQAYTSTIYLRLSRSGMTDTLVYLIGADAGSGFTMFIPLATVKPNTIYRLAFVTDTTIGPYGQIRFYMDGIKLESVYLRGPRLPDRNILFTYIGKSTFPTVQALNGNLYLLKIFNRVLTDEEVIADILYSREPLIAIEGSKITMAYNSTNAPVLTTGAWTFSRSQWLDFRAATLLMQTLGFSVTLVMTVTAAPGEEVGRVFDFHSGGTTNSISLHAGSSNDVTLQVYNIDTLVFSASFPSEPRNSVVRIGFVYDPLASTNGDLTYWIDANCNVTINPTVKFSGRTFNSMLVGQSWNPSITGLRANVHLFKVYSRVIGEEELFKDIGLKTSPPVISINGSTVFPSSSSLKPPIWIATDKGWSFTASSQHHFVFGTQNFTMGTTGFTATMIFQYLAPISNFQKIFDFIHNAESNTIAFGRDPATKRFCFYIRHGTSGTSWHYIISKRLLQTGTTYRVAVTFDPTTGLYGQVSMYFNGTLSDTFMYPGPRMTNRMFSQTFVGRPPTAAESYFSGMIYLLNMYNRVLSDAEIFDETGVASLVVTSTTTSTTTAVQISVGFSVTTFSAPLIQLARTTSATQRFETRKVLTSTVPQETLTYLLISRHGSEQKSTTVLDRISTALLTTVTLGPDRLRPSDESTTMTIFIVAGVGGAVVVFALVLTGLLFQHFERKKVIERQRRESVAPQNVAKSGVPTLPIQPPGATPLRRTSSGSQQQAALRTAASMNFRRLSSPVAMPPAGSRAIVTMPVLYKSDRTRRMSANYVATVFETGEGTTRNISTVRSATGIPTGTAMSGHHTDPKTAPARMEQSPPVRVPPIVTQTLQESPIEGVQEPTADTTSPLW